MDVRLLVPGTSDIPLVGAISRAGYHALLTAGVRIYEWNGSMLHAKTAVADGRWARVGSSNLNIASWMENCELDVVVEDEAFARRMEAQYLEDLRGATEIVLHPRRGDRRHSERKWPRTGGSGPAAASALRLANTVGAAVTNRRVLVSTEGGILFGGALVLLGAAAVAIFWPRALAWPLAGLALWAALALLIRFMTVRRARAPAP